MLYTITQTRENGTAIVLSLEAKDIYEAFTKYYSLCKWEYDFVSVSIERENKRVIINTSEPKVAGFIVE